MKQIILIFAFFLIFCNSALSHNPLSAKYYLEKQQGFGILNIYLSTVGLDQAIQMHYPEKNLSEIEDNKYKEIVIKYLKENFNLKINQTKINLLSGGIKIGNHQTNIKFITDKVPENIKKINANIAAFSENTAHQTILVFSDEITSKKIILNSQNDYSEEVNFENQESKKKSNHIKLLVFFVISLTILSIAYIKISKFSLLQSHHQ